MKRSNMWTLLNIDFEMKTLEVAREWPESTTGEEVLKDMVDNFDSICHTLYFRVYDSLLCEDDDEEDSILGYRFTKAGFDDEFETMQLDLRAKGIDHLISLFDETWTYAKETITLALLRPGETDKLLNILREMDVLRYS